MQFLVGRVREEGIQGHEDDQYAGGYGMERPNLRQEIHLE